jgi:hypothetical protein
MGVGALVGKQAEQAVADGKQRIRLADCVGRDRPVVGVDHRDHIFRPDVGQVHQQPRCLPIGGQQARLQAGHQEGSACRAQPLCQLRLAGRTQIGRELATHLGR